MSRNVNVLVILTVLSLLAISASAAPQWTPKVVCPSDYAKTPIEHGRADLVAALRSLGSARVPGGMTFHVCCPGDMDNAAVDAAAKVLPKKPESFAIARSGKDIAILGTDRTGAMYGCFELAEMIGLSGRAALDIRKPIVKSPAVEFRAINPFITLPYDEPRASWYFLRDDYWKGYLDLLARSRINWIDLHGMYNIRTTWFPNIYPYFVTSDKFPKAGAEPRVAERNMAMLKKIMRWAKERGIKFALMSYAATWDGPGLRASPYENTEENLAEYTREVVGKMVDACPDLDMIGFRIGESGKKESFYKASYIPAIEEVGRPIGLHTRTWGASKDSILELGEEFAGRFFIEIKYNGEQFGPSYIIQGGRARGWRDYFYEEYYSYPKAYKIIYQLRANGTHRAFPWGSPVLAARANKDSLLCGAIGLCVEPIDAYYPKYDYRHKSDYPNKWYKWQWQRDWFWYQTWGRTGYDPSLADRDDIWTAMFARHFGAAPASDLFRAMEWASKIVPDAYTAYSLGPDHRNHASEYEWGGDVEQWAKGMPFDTQNVQSPREYAERLVKGEFSARATPMTMSGYLEEEARMTRYYLDLARQKVGAPNAEFNDLVTELTMLSYLGDYYSHKLLAAALFAVMEASNNAGACQYADAERIREELQLAKEAWDKLAAMGDQYYRPFIDKLRMGTEEFTWSKEGLKLAADFEALDKAIAAVAASSETSCTVNVWSRGDAEGPDVADANGKLEWLDPQKSKMLTVTARVTDPSGVARVILKTKPFPSKRDWTITEMETNDGAYVGSQVVPSEGMLWCIEALDTDGNGTMWPDFRKETPYRVVEPWDDGIREISNGAGLSRVSLVAPRIDDYSAMVATYDATALDQTTRELKLRILDMVVEGKTLVIFHQHPGTWDMSWLGGDIRFADRDLKSVRFVGSHPILEGLPEEMTAGGIVVDALEGGDSSWTHLTDPKALAIREIGKGSIVLVQMDIRPAIDPAMKRLVTNVLRFARRESDKPVLVIDTGDKTIYGLLGNTRTPYVSLGSVVAGL